MRFLGVFTAPGGQGYARGTRVIARTDRGLEAGEVLSQSDEEILEQIKDPSKGQILRAMTPEDENELERIRQHTAEEMQVCQRHVDKLGLAMQLVDVEHIFGGERVIVYYLADNRVDFRELVKRLAGEFQTRIEMRQIGVRDEAKLLADYGDCGVPVCCNNHLAQMPPVSMKMAKLQKATLDPTKISGRCGRLKCCLRYEYETYEQILKELPPIGSMVETPEGSAKVVGHELLAEQVVVATEDHRRLLIHVADTEMPRAEG
jgi:cell fate regulator YaaT (PSP1 superfamily)